MAKAVTPSTFIPFTPKECRQCGATDKKLLKCARCHFERYCSSACQKKDWPRHKQLCRKSSHPEMAWKTLKGMEENWTGDLDKPVKPEGFLKRINPEIENLRDCWNYFAKDAPIQFVPSLLVQYFCEPLNADHSKFSLDLGAGNGYATLFLAQRGWHATALDLSPAANEMLRTGAPPSLFDEGTITIFTQDIHSYSFPPLSYDLVVANDIFPYCNPSRLQSLLADIHGTLKEQGALIGSFFLDFRESDPGIFGLQKEMGAWHLKDAEMANALIISSGFDCIILQVKEGEHAVEFYATKRTFT